MDFPYKNPEENQSSGVLSITNIHPKLVETNPFCWLKFWWQSNHCKNSINVIGCNYRFFIQNLVYMFSLWENWPPSTTVRPNKYHPYLELMNFGANALLKTQSFIKCKMRSVTLFCGTVDGKNPAQCKYRNTMIYMNTAGVACVVYSMHETQPLKNSAIVHVNWCRISSINTTMQLPMPPILPWASPETQQAQHWPWQTVH